MRYLIDTHVALWVLKGEPVSDKAKKILDDVTIWLLYPPMKMYRNML